MNIVMIMSGGVGSRFGTVIPKQYNLIAGKPVIDYVIDAVKCSSLTDKIVVVMDSQYMGYSESLKHSDFDFAPNGKTRLESMYNGLKLINEKYPCDKIVIVDAVAPFLYADLIDDYFRKLDDYDAVITAQKITGGFTDINDSKLDRERFIITQSPEGFRFALLWNNFDVNFPYQETAGMLPEGSRRFYNYDFRNNLKLTYDFELAYAEHMLRHLGKLNRESNIAFFDKSILITEGLRAFLLRNEFRKTQLWLDEVYSNMPKLIARWNISSFVPNQVSRYGLVLQAKSQTLGDVVMKFIPEFVGRFERELEAMRLLPESYMCPLLDADEDCRCMLLKRITPAKYASFEENLKLTEFFRNAVNDAVEYTESHNLKHIPLYYDELMQKLANLDIMPYGRAEIEPELVYAAELYRQKFSGAKLYILHGDLHELNILDDNKRFWGIDPNGMLAPLELECVRFIRNDVRSHPSFGFAHRFELLMQSFSRFVDIHRLADMFIIDMAFITYNSVFENEDISQETLADLEIIRIAKEWRAAHEAI